MANFRNSGREGNPGCPSRESLVPKKWPLRGFLWVAPTGCSRSSRAVCPPPSRHGELGGFAPKPPGFIALRARAAWATIALPLRRIGLRWEPTERLGGGRAAGDDSPKAVVPAVFLGRCPRLQSDKSQGVWGTGPPERRIQDVVGTHRKPGRTKKCCRHCMSFLWVVRRKILQAADSPQVVTPCPHVTPSLTVEGSSPQEEAVPLARPRSEVPKPNGRFSSRRSHTFGRSPGILGISATADANLPKV